MELSDADIKRLERVGYHRQEFSVSEEDGLTRLRNLVGWCYFYDVSGEKCRVYHDRPLGCSIYPVVYSAYDDVITTDELCPMRQTITASELRTKGRILVGLLKRIDSEAKKSKRK
jgi:Fe-S-cluster containining protein